MEIRPVGVELFPADGRTDRQTHMTELTVAFRNFANTLKNKMCQMKTCQVDSIYFHKTETADPGGRGLYGIGLRLLDCWDRVFESRWEHGCSSIAFVRVL